MGINSKLKTAALALVLVSVTTIIAARTLWEQCPWSQEWESSYTDGFVYSYKFEPAAGQTWPDTWTITHGGNTITITVYYDGDDWRYFDWTASSPISAVIVKGGTCANVFEYSPPQSSDTKLYAPTNPQTGKPYGLSHITFCWNPPTGVPEFPLTPEAIVALGLVAWIAVRRRRKL